jgi:hypothetical protein
MIAQISSHQPTGSSLNFKELSSLNLILTDNMLSQLNVLNMLPGDFLYHIT